MEFAWLEGEGGARVLCGWDGTDGLAALGGLPMKLPEGDYALEGEAIIAVDRLGLGSYQFLRYRAAKRAPARPQRQIPTWSSTTLAPSP